MTPEVPFEKYLLYADDDHDDQLMMQEMITDIDPKLGVVTFENGLHLLNFLHALPADAVYPCFIILDINMPVYDGIQTLKELKADKRYKPIPVVMFSTSNAKGEKDSALQSGAETYITKPVHSAEIEQVTHQFTTYCHEQPIQTKPS